MGSEEELNNLHLADLHAKAAEAGINGYRMLSREELIAEIQAGGKRKRSRWPRRKAPKVDAETNTDELAILEEDGVKPDEDSDAEPPPRPARRRGRRGGRGRGGPARERLGADRDDPPQDEEVEEITGTLEITRQRHGFLAVEGSEDDVYVSASQVRRCELSDGDEVTGPARAPRRGERHRALVRVNLVNGEPPVEAPAGKDTDQGGSGPRSGAKAGAPKGSVEVALIRVDEDHCVIEVNGTEHELQPGDRVTVPLDPSD